MAAIMCELCGSNDVVKQGEYFVCQHCGTKYTVEDAKKLIGTVKIDKTDEVQKYLQIARNAKQKEDWEESAKYYSLVEASIPDHLEAFFYSVYGKAFASLSVNDFYKRKAIFESLGNCLKIIRKETIIAYKYADFAKNDGPFIQQLSNDIIKLTSAGFVYTEHTTDGAYSGDNAHETYTLYLRINSIMADFVNGILGVVENGEKICKEDKIEYFRFCAPISIKHLTHNAFMPCLPKREFRLDCAKTVGEVHEYWHKFDSEHIVPNNQELIDAVNKSIGSDEKAYYQKTGPCYVATAVYGSYDCPQVWTLRRYRDYTLAETWLGRLFILLYYAISPTLVKWFGETHWFKNLWKPRLDKMVKRLNEEGVADTPYQDRQW